MSYACIILVILITLYLIRKNKRQDTPIEPIKPIEPPKPAKPPSLKLPESPKLKDGEIVTV